MAKPLDDDLRKRMVGTMREVGCRRAVGRQFRVAASTVSRLMKRIERTGSRGKAKVRDREKLWPEACGILERIEPGECANYLRHAGYVANKVLL